MLMSWGVGERQKYLVVPDQLNCKCLNSTKYEPWRRLPPQVEVSVLLLSHPSRSVGLSKLSKWTDRGIAKQTKIIGYDVCIVYVCIYIFVCMYIMYAYVCICACKDVYNIHMRTYVHSYIIHAHIYKYNLYACMYARILCMSVFMYGCMYVHVYTYVCMH